MNPTPEEHASELIKTFKEAEMFEYDIVERHAVKHARKCCTILIQALLSGRSDSIVINHYKSVLNILTEKLK